MAQANAVDTLLKRVVQSGLGTAGSSGSQYMRRVTAPIRKSSQTYSSNEIVSHQQSTGATDGPSTSSIPYNTEISAGSNALEWANLLRKDFAALSPEASVAITIAGSGPTYTLTRSSGWLTAGFKKGHVVRLSVGSLNAANIAKNLLIVSITQTVATVIPLNGVAMVAEGPISGCTTTAVGKTTWAPTSGHTNAYYSWELWNSIVSVSELLTDAKAAAADVDVPATGIATCNWDIQGLTRTLGASEVLTSPTAATTTDVMAAVQGKAVINGTVTNLTGIKFKVDGDTSAGAAEIGSNSHSDLVRGKISVSGTVTAKFTSSTLMALRDSQTTVALIFVIAANGTATSDFISFVMPAAKIFTDDGDDGKEIVRTYNFTAQYYGSGGSGTDSQQSIFMIQDSQAP